MKIYEKPRLMVLSVSANDALCTGCAVKTRGDALFNMLDQTPGYGDGNGIFNSADPLFSEADTNCTAHSDSYTQYCKFTGAESQRLFTS